jgi:hypothetical protein
MGARRKAAPGSTLHEVLVEYADGHRTVHRFYAPSAEAAVAEVAAKLSHGDRVLESRQRTPFDAGGLGSSDGR